MPESILPILVQLPVVAIVLIVVVLMLRRQDARDRHHRAAVTEERQAAAAERHEIAEKERRTRRRLARAIDRLGVAISDLRTDIHTKHAEIQRVLVEVKSLECHPARHEQSDVLAQIRPDKQREG
jgi:uncharacterized protein YlxW (UPF0749 family)